MRGESCGGEGARGCEGSNGGGGGRRWGRVPGAGPPVSTELPGEAAATTTTSNDALNHHKVNRQQACLRDLGHSWPPAANNAKSIVWVYLHQAAVQQVSHDGAPDEQRHVLVQLDEDPDLVVRVQKPGPFKKPSHGLKGRNQRFSGTTRKQQRRNNVSATEAVLPVSIDS